MKKKQENYRFINRINVDKTFYEGFDPGFLYNKARALLIILNDEDKFIEMAKWVEDGIAHDKKYFESLRAEIYFTSMHQAEVLFALMFAFYQDLPHWLYLSMYKTIKPSVDLFLKGKIADLTHNKVNNYKDFIKQTVYSGYERNNGDNAKWCKNIDDIEWILIKLAEIYLKGNEYNSYKHGLRVFTGESAFGFSVNGSDDVNWLAASQDSLTFLESKDEADYTEVYKTTKMFNMQESFNYLYIMYIILKNIKKTRLARIKGEKGSEINMITGFDKDKFMLLGAGKAEMKWQV
ncbi:MAG: hypothetical protein ACYDEQ_00645 [Desulfocucumaceae bacterium]